MWFTANETELEVAHGAIYRGPGDGLWVIASRTTRMGGIELFQSTLDPTGEVWTLEHTAHQADGTTLETRETWTFPDSNRIEYAVYRPGESDPWITGAWQRVEREASSEKLP